MTPLQNRVTGVAGGGEARRELLDQQAQPAGGPGGASLDEQPRGIDRDPGVVQGPFDMKEFVGDSEQADAEAFALGYLETQLDLLSAQIDGAAPYGVDCGSLTFGVGKVSTPIDSEQGLRGDWNLER